MYVLKRVWRHQSKAAPELPWPEGGMGDVMMKPLVTDFADACVCVYFWEGGGEAMKNVHACTEGTERFYHGKWYFGMMILGWRFYFAWGREDKWGFRALKKRKGK